MKKTIIETLKEKRFNEQVMKDGSLLFFTETEDKKRIATKVWYLDGNSTIREQVLRTFTREEFENDLDNLIEWNEDSTAIAFYRKTEEGYVVDDMYYVEDHHTAGQDEIDAEYHLMFPNNEVTFTLVKKRGWKDGKHQNRTSKPCDSRRN